MFNLLGLRERARAVDCRATYRFIGSSEVDSRSPDPSDIPFRQWVFQAEIFINFCKDTVSSPQIPRSLRRKFEARNAKLLNTEPLRRSIK